MPVLESIIWCCHSRVFRLGLGLGLGWGGGSGPGRAHAFAGFKNFLKNLTVPRYMNTSPPTIAVSSADVSDRKRSSALSRLPLNNAAKKYVHLMWRPGDSIECASC